MASDVHVGTADLPHGMGWDRYFERLDFIETSVLTRKAARPSVLAKWRAAAPGPGAFALVAPPIGSDLATFHEAAKVLDAGVLLFHTPPSFTPSAANRDRLRRFFTEEVPPGDAVRVWHPEGLWDLRTAVKLASELGVAFGCDPLIRDQTRDPPELYATLGIPDVYFRVTGLGRGTRTLPSSQLEEIAMILEFYERAWVVFATVDSIADATRFKSRTSP